VKIRIGVGAGAPTPAALTQILDATVEHGFDSIWFSELLTGDGLDPVVALSWAARHHPRLKLGTTMLLPGRNVVRLAKQLASIDALSEGRLLVTFVSGINQPPEREAIGLPLAARRGAIEEALPLLRRLLAGDTVTHRGDVASFTDVRLAPLPVQQPLEFWLGGIAPRSLELCGRLGEGWLPSLCTPAQAAAGRDVIERVAAAEGRTISPEHFGVSIGYSHGPLSEAALARITRRAGSDDIARLVPTSLDALRTLLREYIDVGFSKFVIRPFVPPDSWQSELAAAADAVLDLQT